MLMARVKFGKCPSAIDTIVFDDLAHTFMAALLRNWQILHQYDLCWLDDQMFAYTLLPTAAPPEPQYFSEWTNQALNKLLETGAQIPLWELLDDRGSDELLSLDADTTFVLFTHFLDKHSPLMCLKSVTPVAPYIIPKTVEVQDEFYSWTNTYRDIDSLWMSSSGALESAMYALLSNPSSELSKQGRALCKYIESVTNRPAYYFLFTDMEKKREWKSSMRTEDNRAVEIDDLSKCPSCSESWIRQSLIEQPKFRDLFYYQCHPCRLIGNHIPG
ncbi:MAG: DUF2310 family Zn-ribbon-containing protein [Cyanobacteria bacterium SZAS-4]|nr:DUF2310 family Zn-ribbon-containing protein [Cyanobacteria bacterium SZAS-4]